MMSLILLLYTILAIIAKGDDRCKGLYDADGNVVQPLGVCYQVSIAEFTGSYRGKCNDDGEPVLEAFLDDSCSSIGSDQDFDQSYVNATCDGTRCPYAVIRTYTNADCSDGGFYTEFTIPTTCTVKSDSSQRYTCTDTNVTLNVYDTTDCSGTPTSTTIEYEDDECDDLGGLTQVEECNMDRAYKLSIVASFIISLFGTIMYQY